MEDLRGRLLREVVTLVYWLVRVWNLVELALMNMEELVESFSSRFVLIEEERHP